MEYIQNTLENQSRKLALHRPPFSHPDYPCRAILTFPLLCSENGDAPTNPWFKRLQTADPSAATSYDSSGKQVNKVVNRESARPGVGVTTPLPKIRSQNVCLSPWRRTHVDEEIRVIWLIIVTGTVQWGQRLSDIAVAGHHYWDFPYKRSQR
jgi:hypothetical protein